MILVPQLTCEIEIRPSRTTHTKLIHKIY